MPSTITLSQDATVLTIALNRPEKRNALNAQVVHELHDAVRYAAANEETRVLVLTGNGDAFCAGADLEYLLEISSNSPLENAADSYALMEMLYALRTFPKPTIAKVHGPAIAGGCGLALTCDIVAADVSSKFGFTEVRIGFIPAIVMKLLVERIGLGNAREMLLRGHIIDPVIAMDLGMINYVLPTDQLDVSVQRLAEEIATKTSPQAVQLTKQLLGDIEAMDLREAMEHAATFNALSRTSDNFHTGITSFLQKEKPVW